jgi:DNA polymerase sigma
MNSKNMKLSKLLLDFFHFFGSVHDYANVGIAVNGVDPEYESAILFNKQDLGLYDPRASNTLCVLDPLDPSNNVTRGCSKIALIAAHFAAAYKSLISQSDQFKLAIDGRYVIKGYLSRILFI